MFVFSEAALVWMSAANLAQADVVRICKGNAIDSDGLSGLYVTTEGEFATLVFTEFSEHDGVFSGCRSRLQTVAFVIRCPKRVVDSGSPLAIQRSLAKEFGVPSVFVPGSEPVHWYCGPQLPRELVEHHGKKGFRRKEFFLHSRGFEQCGACFLSLEKYSAWVSNVLNRPLVLLPAVQQSVAGQIEDTSQSVSVADELDSLCDELFAIIDKPDHSEEELHQFLRAHHVFLEFDAVQVWSKLPFGNKDVSDFVVRRSDNTYLLIEIEKARDRILNNGDCEKAKALRHAMQQVEDWQRFIRDGDIRGIQDEYELPSISEPQGMVIVGRESLIGTKKKARQRWQTLKNKTEPLVFNYDEICERVRQLARRIRSGF